MGIIRVKCPNCGNVLKINEDIASKNIKIKCPVCGVANPASIFEPYVPPKEEETTQIAELQNDTSGYFIDERTSFKYVVPDGKKSLFGRMTLQSPSKADVPIDVQYPEGLDKGVSRSHFWIESVLSSDGKYHVYISNAQNVNKTFINGSVLEDDNVIGLKDGGKVSCSNMVLRFVKPSAPAPASSKKADSGDDEDGTLI